MTNNKPDYILGLDLGQSQDYTALAILERTRKRCQRAESVPAAGAEPAKKSVPQDGVPPSEKMEFHYFLRYLKRWKLKTPYPDIVSEVGDLVLKHPLEYPCLAVDQTGVGVAIVDMFRKAGVKARLNPILITGGHEISYADGAHHVPKKELISTAQVLLQSQRLKIDAGLPDAPTLIKELLSFKVKITIAANETFEAWRARDHDDLVLAVAMAAWLGEGGQANPGYMEVLDPSPRPNFDMGIFGSHSRRR